MNNNRWFRISLVRSNALTAVAAGSLGLLLVFLRMRLWRLNPSVPVLRWSEALYNCVLVKALAEGTWNYHIVRLAANLAE